MSGKGQRQLSAAERVQADWMKDEALQKVVAALTADGRELRFVGGCVRDSLAGRPVKDIDLATPEPPESVMEQLTKAGLKAVPTGLAHGTVTAVADHKGFEITTLRHDLETDGRHAKVGFTDDWEADAARRDLTFNAMSLSPEGRLFDPFGGADDLAAGRVRFVGKAEQRITEDYLRLLRFFRFYAYYGRGALDAEARAAAKALAPKLQTLSVERVREELLRILAAPDPLPVLGEMKSLGVLSEALPEAGGLALLTAFLSQESRFGLAPEGLLRLACLITWFPSAVTDLAQRLRLSNAQRRRLERTTALARSLQRGGVAVPEELPKLLHREGPPILSAALQLFWAALASDDRPAPEQEMSDVWAAVRSWQAQAFPLKGKDLLVEGVSQGPKVGLLLAEMETWWLSAGRPDRFACLKELRARLKDGA